MEQLNKEQLTKVKEQIQQVLNSLYVVVMDYQNRLQFVEKQLNPEKPTVTATEKKPAESTKK